MVGTALRVFALTFASRLVPGVSTALATHLAAIGEKRRAVELLAVVTGVDLVLFWSLVEGPGRGMIVRVGDLAHRYQGGALIVLGLVILGRALFRTFSGLPVRAGPGRCPGSPAVMGLAAAVFYPGRWMWWATFGVTVCSLVSRDGSISMKVGFLSFFAALTAVNTLTVGLGRWIGVLDAAQHAALEAILGTILLFVGLAHLLGT